MLFELLLLQKSVKMLNIFLIKNYLLFFLLFILLLLFSTTTIKHHHQCQLHDWETENPATTQPFNHPTIHLLTTIFFFILNNTTDSLSTWFKKKKNYLIFFQRSHYNKTTTKINSKYWTIKNPHKKFYFKQKKEAREEIIKKQSFNK